MSIKCQPRPASPGRKTQATIDREAKEDDIRNTLSETEKFKLTMVLDSQHDFCEDERQRANEGGVLLEFYNVSGTNKVLKYMLSTSHDPNSAMLVKTYDKICCRADGNPIANEEFAEYLTCVQGTSITAVKGTIENNVSNVRQIIEHFGYTFQLTSNNPVYDPVTVYKPSLPPVTQDGSNNIYLFCDAGPAIFKTLIEDCVPPIEPDRGKGVTVAQHQNTWEKLYSTNLVHTLTPATLCDSANITRCQAFFNPTIFMRPPSSRGGEGSSDKSDAYASLSSLFGTTIYASSEEYNASGPNNMGLLYISDSKYEDTPLVMENSVTSVPTLGYNIIKSFHDDSISDKAIPEFEEKDLGRDGWDLARNNKLNIKDKSGKSRIERDFKQEFTYRQAFDIKRAADSDQVYHTYLIVQHKRRNEDPNFKYIFCTGDRICAFIAFYYYGLNTMYMVKSNKTYKLWKERQPAYPELIRLHGYINQDGTINHTKGTVLGGSRKNKSSHLPQHGGVPIYNASLNAWYNKNTGNFINTSVTDLSADAIYKPTSKELLEIKREDKAQGRRHETITTQYGYHKMYQLFQMRQKAFLDILRSCKDKLQNLIFEANPKLAIIASFNNIKINHSNKEIETLLIYNHNNLYDCAQINKDEVDEALVAFNHKYDHIKKILYNDDLNLSNILLDIVNNATQNFNYDASKSASMSDDPLAYILKLINTKRTDSIEFPLPNILQTLGVLGECIDNSYDMESSLIFNYFFDDIHNKKSILLFKQDINTIIDAPRWDDSLYRIFNKIIIQLYQSLITKSARNNKTYFVHLNLRGAGRRTLKRRRRNNRKTRKSRK